MKKYYIFLIVVNILVLPFRIEGQGIENFIKYLTVYPNKKAVERDSTIYPSKAIFTPIVSYAPETSLSFGVGMKGLFKLKGSGPETRTSNIPITAQYTIENKYLFFSGFQIFFPEERYILAGNLWVLSFPSLYFGVGKDTPASNKEKFSYNRILFEPIFLKNLFVPNFYMGGGFRYNRISNVEAEPDGLLENSRQPGALGATSSGVQLAMIYDSRDNLLNAKEGFYIAITHGFYGKFLGGTQRYGLTRFDLRYYTQPLKTPNSVLAFQFTTHISHGEPPLQELGRFGGSKVMRGYFEGRYTDRHLFSTQIEWRQKLTPKWGVTAFVGLGGVAPKINEFSMNTTRPAMGLGLRFLIDKKEDLNLRLDFASGQKKVKNYFNVAEAF